MNGILNINKPPGITSFGVIAFLRKNLRVKKIGHLGTLDPDAKGVLPVCVGRATKAVEFLMDKDKRYKVELQLGVKTNTGDATGDVLETREVLSSKEEIQKAVGAFLGESLQVPPMFSALKINGQKLCDLARKGVTVDRKPRKINIYEIKILEILEDKVFLEVHCSKGTYIRTLCEDIGEKLSCGGHMKDLVRIASGRFSLEDALTLEEILDRIQQRTIEENLIPVETCFLEVPEIILEDESAKKFINGGWIYGEEKPKELCRVYNKTLFLGLGSVMMDEKGCFLKSIKLF
jgi:tRNA pseudouridine55 synthase